MSEKINMSDISKDYKPEDAFFNEDAYYMAEGNIYSYDILVLLGIIDDVITFRTNSDKVKRFTDYITEALVKAKDKVDAGLIGQEDYEAFETFITKVTEHMTILITLNSIADLNDPKTLEESRNALHEMCKNYTYSANFGLLIGTQLPKGLKSLNVNGLSVSYFGKVLPGFIKEVVNYKTAPHVVSINPVTERILTSVLGVPADSVVNMEAIYTVIDEALSKPLSNTDRVVIYTCDNYYHNVLVRYISNKMTELGMALESKINILVRPMDINNHDSNVDSVLWDVYDEELAKKHLAEIGVMIEQAGGENDKG